MTRSNVQIVPAVTVPALYEALLRDEAPFILDVRNSDDFVRWRIEGRASLTVRNIPYYTFLEDEDASIAQVPTGQDVLVVCAKEGSSQYVAELLREHGIRASYLEGGILSWAHLYDSDTVYLGHASCLRKGVLPCWKNYSVASQPAPSRNSV